MVFFRPTWAVVAALVFTTASNCHPTSNKVVHERRDTVHAEWNKIARANPDTPLTLRIGLKQSNLERAEEFMDSVAHPRSEQYGIYWTPQKVADTFAPSDEAISETEGWLQIEGVTVDRLSKSNGRNWIRVKTTVGEAEKLLDTTYNVYENDDGAKIVACEAYSVPAAVQEHIDLITPTIQFDTKIAGLHRRDIDRRNVIAPKVKKLPFRHHHDHDDESLDKCSELTTPACLRAITPNPPKATPSDNFLDAIDGSYCSFDGGDDPINGDAVYPHDPSWPGAYTGPNQCGVWNATKVISVSYGRDEIIRPRSYTARECTEYLKLGLMGVTVMFSSGDRGVAGVSGRCLTPNGGYVPIWAPGIFNPVFPATCPWITSVGGSSLPVNGTVRSKEVVAQEFWPSGGFSNYFPLPKYQQAAVKNYYRYHNPGYNSSMYNDTQQARGFPDIALMSQNFITGLDGDFWAFTGTSASSPLLGAMITLINGERLKAGKGTVGFINPVLYEHPEIFSDVVEGSIGGCYSPGFSAVKGWDPASGLGTTTYAKLKKLFMSLP